MELVNNVSRAALNVNLRMMIDPRQGVRYVATLASRLMQLQGALILRAVLVTEPAAEAPQHAEDMFRSMA
jgi:hypothetical protein